ERSRCKPFIHPQIYGVNHHSTGRRQEVEQIAGREALARVVQEYVTAWKPDHRLVRRFGLERNKQVYIHPLVVIGSANRDGLPPVSCERILTLTARCERVTIVAVQALQQAEGLVAYRCRKLELEPWFNGCQRRPGRRRWVGRTPKTVHGRARPRVDSYQMLEHVGRLVPGTAHAVAKATWRQVPRPLSDVASHVVGAEGTQPLEFSDR